jgi:hypothetical protein
METSTTLLQKHENSQIYVNSTDLTVEFIADDVIRRFCWYIAGRDFCEEDFWALLHVDWTAGKRYIPKTPLGACNNYQTEKRRN